MKDFLSRWGVQHRVSSAYYPRANKRAEVGVKSAKRLVMDNLGPGGSLDTDKFARALLVHRNCPDAESGFSPAQIIFGRELRDHLPALVSRYQPRQEWRLEADQRAQAMAKRHGRMEKLLQHGARALPPLKLGDTVAIQDQAAKNGKAGRWTKSGVVVEILPHDSYMVKVHGNRSITQRNRRFLRRLFPFKPVNPVPQEEKAHNTITRPVVKTRSTMEDQQSTDRVTTRSQRVVINLPASSTAGTNQVEKAKHSMDSKQSHDKVSTSAASSTPVKKTSSATLAAKGASHRRIPLASPGENILTKLKIKEQMGTHLSLSH